MFTYYANEIEGIGLRLERLVTSSLIAYDEGFHQDIMDDTREIMRGIEDSDMTQEQKSLLIEMLDAYYNYAVEDIQKY